MAEAALDGEHLSLFDVVLTNRKQLDGFGPQSTCTLQFGEVGAETLVSVVPITVVSGKLLAAVLFLTWHKTPARRILPRDGLARPILVQVSVAPDISAGSAEAEEVVVKAWIGFLSAELAATGTVGALEEEHEVACFGEEAGVRVQLPEEALVNIADEHFGFVTAESGAAGEVGVAASRAKKKSKDDPQEARLRMLEAAMEEIRSSLASLQPKANSSGAAAQPFRGSAVESLPPPLPVYPGLDASAVAAARAAGLPEDQLAKLAAAAGHKPALQEARKRMPQPTNVLSETEDEDKEAALGIGGEGEAGGATQPVVERAVVQLAKIVKNMQKDKSTRSGLEGILDRAEGSSSIDSAGGQTSGTRGKAAAYKKLKAALQDNPEWLFTNVEALMDEDFMLVRAAPGSSHQPTTSRAWVEQRSKLLHFQSAIRATWLLAGIHDALKGRTSGRRESTRCSQPLGLRSGCPGQWKLATSPGALSGVGSAIQLLPEQEGSGLRRASLVAAGGREDSRPLPVEAERQRCLHGKQKAAQQHKPQRPPIREACHRARN